MTTRVIAYYVIWWNIEHDMYMYLDRSIILYTCIYIFIHAYINRYSICMYISNITYIYLYIHMIVYVYICVYTYMYTCVIYTCTYVQREIDYMLHIYTYIYIHIWLSLSPSLALSLSFSFSRFLHIMYNAVIFYITDISPTPKTLILPNNDFPFQSLKRYLRLRVPGHSMTPSARSR